MNNILLQNKINMLTTINSVLYGLRKLKITKKENIPSFLKKIIYIITIILNIVRIIFIKIVYLYIIYFLIKLINGKYNYHMFINYFIFLSVFGSIINSRIISTSKAKYHSIILLNIDSKKYVISDILFNIITTFLFQIITFFLLNQVVSLLPVKYILLLSIFISLIKLVGEWINLLYYKLKHNIILNNTVLYFLILIILISIPTILSITKVFITKNQILTTNIVLLILSIISLTNIIKENNYKKMYKRIININGYSLNDGNSFSKEEIFTINDYEVERKNYKSIYKYFNSIFIKRHNKILLNGVITTSVIIFIIGVSSLILINYSNYNEVVRSIIIKYFMWIFLLIYLINKTQLMTEAMFFNCDRSLLRYDFYREKKVINSIFKERLKSLIYINLLPVVILDIFINLILYLTTTIPVINLILLFISIIMISVFITTHFMCMYYLFEPYDKDSKVKDFRFQIINTFLLVLLFFLSTIKVKIILLSIITIISTLIYCSTLIYLVLKKSHKTFKIH